MQKGAKDSPLVKEAEAARILDLSKRTLQKWRVEGHGPVYIRVSARAIRYRLVDLESWINERVRSSTSEATVRQEPPRDLSSRTARS